MSPDDPTFNEARRLASLRQYAVLDSPPEQAFDDLVVLAARLGEMPIALIILLDAHRQWFKAKIGIDLQETTREGAFCLHVLRSPELFVVEDASQDPVFANNPLVNGAPAVRFYAGTPLFSPEGHALGVLCVCDRAPRTLTPEQRHSLSALGRQVMAHLELRRLRREREVREQRLHRIEGKLQEFFEAEADCVKLLEADGTLVDMNPAGLRLIEAASMEAVAGRSLMGQVDPEDRASVASTLQSVANGARQTIEFRFRSLKDTPLWIEMRAVPSRDETNGRNLILGHSRDITARKLAEAKLHRLNRLYAVSSAINAAIVRTRDRQELYESACRIAVEQGGLIMAWVGLAEPQGFALEPVARWGRDEGYLDSVRISVSADAIEGRGPAGIAFRTGKPSWCNDIAHVESFAWRKEAGERGFKSCAVFPLTHGGRSVGIMAVYGGEAHYFDTEELQLLNALAENLSFAVESQQREEQRQIAEKALRESDERFRLLSKATNDAIWDWNFATNEYWWNEGLWTLFGFSPQDVEPAFHWWSDRIHPEDRERVVQGIRRAACQGDRTWSTEYRFQRKDGTYARVLDRAYVMRDANSKPVRMIGSMTDLSDRMQAEARIAEQAALLDQARDAIMVRDLNHHITYCNKSAERLYGWSAQEMLGRSIRELLYVDPTPFDAAVRKVFEEGEWIGELIQLGKDRRELIVESRWTLVRDERGAPRAVFAINTDVSEKKALERQFFRAQRMESIGTLAGGIAHDLNNALAPVIMCLDMLKMRVNDADGLELIEIISASAERGVNMVRQVLSFARGVEGLRLEVKVENLVREIEKIANDTFLKHINIRTVIAPGIWSIVGDATQLHQVLLNLCVNARDAMPRGGILTISAENFTVAAPSTGLSGDEVPGSYVLFQIKDTGTGIAPGTLEKIFDPFFTTKEVGQGTGLGLSTSLAIVKSHGGFIHVESEQGLGTTFKVYLPARVAETETAIETVSQMPRGRGERILVVDDENIVRQITKRTLETFGYRVVLASDGAEALVIFDRERQEIDAVLTDMTMPVMDGPTSIEKLLQLDPKLPIIAASGLASSRQVEKVTNLGVKHFLPKPYTARSLLEVLQRVFTGN